MSEEESGAVPALRERIVLAVLNVLAEGDPVVTVAVGPCEINVGWKPR